MPWSFANAADFPTKLFDVELGAKLGVESGGNSLSGLNGEFKASNRFLGMGIHVYFKPNRQYEDYPYKEFPNKTNYPLTTFRLYAYPVISSI